jgi:predicted ATPase/class 3 adenylate cyclase
MNDIAPPQGIITLMFTDVEGSTARWERFGPRFGEALLIHEQILREAIARQGGYEVKTGGDSFMVAFAFAAFAVRCAVDIQESLAAAHMQFDLLNEVEGVRVRIGLHTGEPAFRDNDYFGPPVNRAARICDAGHGGLILLSHETARLAEDELEEDCRLEDCGLHTLKDLGQPERLFLVRHPRIPLRPFTKLRTLEALPHNFPAQVTSFVGRVREQAELTELLHAGLARLVTLTGPGGTGKTRLAMQVAVNCLQDFPDGIWMVELASLRDTEAVPTAISMALGIQLTADADPRKQVIEFLRPRRSLLLLDNFEHVSDAAPMVSDLLRECRKLTCLVTSRELLHLSGEREYAVDPLTVPPPDKKDNHWTRYESVQLFVERCQAMRADFILTEEAAPVVGDICRRLDGIPLAIELAAARVRGMTPQQVALRMTRRFDLLASGQRDLPERQRTLRKAIDWSYELLSEEERALFAELAVFVGGFSLEAAEEVCLTPGAFDLVFSLRDKSLLKADEQSGQTRYAMLETLREYAMEKLLETGALTELSDRHAFCYLRMAQQWNEELSGAGTAPAEAMAAFTTDMDNVRAGMDWSAMHNDREKTIAYGKALARFLLRRGLYRECDARLAVAEAVAKENGDRTSLARLLNQRGLVAWERFDLDRARSLFTESYEISKELGDRARMLVTLINLGNIMWGHGDFEEARSVWEEALQLAVQTGQPHYEAMLQTDLGILACERGEYEDAARRFADSLAMHTRGRDEESTAFALYNSSELFRRQRQYDRALERIEESRRLYVKLGHKRGLTLTAIRLAVVHLDSGRTDEARVPAQEGLRFAEETGDRACQMYALDVLARLAAVEGEMSQARNLFCRSFAIAEAVGDKRHAADILCHLGRALSRSGSNADAWLLLAVAAREYAARGMVDAADVAMRLDELRADLDPAEADRLDKAATSLSPDEAFARFCPLSELET